MEKTYEVIDVDSKEAKEKNYALKVKRIMDKVIFWFVCGLATYGVCSALSVVTDAIYNNTSIIDGIYDTSLFTMLFFSISLAIGYYVTKYCLTLINNLIIEHFKG